VQKLQRADDLGGVEHRAVVVEPSQFLDVVHQIAAVVELHHEKQMILSTYRYTRTQLVRRKWPKAQLNE